MTTYTNHYYCANCEASWADVWDCMCNDRCPVCNKEIVPEYSEEHVTDN